MYYSTIDHWWSNLVVRRAHFDKRSWKITRFYVYWPLFCKNESSWSLKKYQISDLVRVWCLDGICMVSWTLYLEVISPLSADFWILGLVTNSRSPVHPEAPKIGCLPRRRLILLPTARGADSLLWALFTALFTLFSPANRKHHQLHEHQGSSHH